MSFPMIPKLSLNFGPDGSLEFMAFRNNAFFRVELPPELK